VNALEVAQLEYAYPDGTPALCGANFSVAPGECLGLVGPNGAGKSTLLLALLGFVPARGRVQVGDLTLSRATRREIRRRVGLVFQEPDDQLFMSTVFDDVAFGPLCQGLPAAEVPARVAEALDRVTAADLADRAPFHLSSGEKRRVALAAVLAMRPEIVLFDEPSSNLDPRSRRQLIRLLAAMNCTRLVASHDLELVLELCPRVAVMAAGRIVAEGPTPVLLADAALMERFSLEVPASLAARPAHGQ
jgi:cobalt/nickel transport system ATP-binding protein